MSAGDSALKMSNGNDHQPTGSAPPPTQPFQSRARQGSGHTVTASAKPKRSISAPPKKGPAQLADLENRIGPGTVPGSLESCPAEAKRNPGIV